MCELNKKSYCVGRSEKWFQPLKLSKWESPLPSSKSYWDGICAEIEKKYNKVSQPHSSSFTSIQPIIKNQQPHNHKYETSTLKCIKNSQKYKLKPVQDLDKEIPSSAIKQKSVRFSDLDIALPITNKIQTEIQENYEPIKVYTTKTCPRHKVKAETIPINEIPQFLQTKSSIPKLPIVATEKKVLCEHRKSVCIKSASASLACLNTGQKSSPQKEPQRSKAPKLRMASLMPSFAKTVTIDSSSGTQSSDRDVVSIENKYQRDKIDESIEKYVLKEQQSRLISSQSSSQKLLSTDYSDKEDKKGSPDVSLTREDDSLIVEQSFSCKHPSVVYETKYFSESEKSPDSYTDNKIDNSEISNKKLTSRKDLKKKFLHKALDVITKCQYSKMFNEVNDILEATIIPNAPGNSEISKSNDFKFRRLKNDNKPIDFIEINRELREKTKNHQKSYLRSMAEVDSKKSITICTESRSISGPSSGFENKMVTSLPSSTLQSIPLTNVFNRSHIDKCYACLFKPFEGKDEIKRELPLATLKSIIDCSQHIEDESTTSTSTEEDQPILPNVNIKAETRFDHMKLNLCLSDFSEVKKKCDDSKEMKVSFEGSISSTQKNSSETSLSTKSAPLTPEHHVFDQSNTSQSPDLSKTSTPSNHSSDSEETRQQDDDNLPPSKYLAPCHAPVIWVKPFEPLRALKQKKAISLRARVAALTAASSEGSDDSGNEIVISSKSLLQKRDAAVIPVQEKNDRREKVDKMKILVRTKTLLEMPVSLKSNVELEKSTRFLKRSKTTHDLTTINKEVKNDFEKVDNKDNKNNQDEEKYEEKIKKSSIFTAESPPLLTVTKQEILTIVNKCTKEGFDPTILLNILADEFVQKMEQKRKKLKIIEDRKKISLGLNLFKLLIQSKKFLKSETFSPDLEFSHKQPPLTNSRQLKKILPPKSYDLIAPILGLPIHAQKHVDKQTKEKIEERSEGSENTCSQITFDMIVQPPTERDLLETNSKSQGTQNPYVMFLRKPRRKAVVWRALCEEDMKGYNPEATLEKRTARLMNQICKDFCDWIKELGKNKQIIDEDTLNNMFEINFSAEVCKASQFIFKELPTVPMPLLKIRFCPEAGELEATRRFIARDLGVEKLPKKSHAFGRTLPTKLRFAPPQGPSLSDRWLNCPHIPEDLESMDTIWKGIMHLDSVKSFINYLTNDPKESSQELLKDLLQRQIHDQKSFKESEKSMLWSKDEEQTKTMHDSISEHESEKMQAFLFF
ncbi:hypothetical protein TKK_0016034 [Trichogramma kaykai]|uniref:Uncharacterized protein n=1 Tax=Trichogramma kaykai TaxID=54128 RepID=A0ABD2W9I5_9HYME